MSLHSDILVVGAGPAGLSFAAELAGSGLKITLIEKSPLEILQNPPYDGREIALTHLSREIMQRLGMWDLIPKDETTISAKPLMKSYPNWKTSPS